MVAATDIGQRLRGIEARLAAACARAGRRRAEVTLIGASKMQPVAALRQAWDAGLRTFGENRVQEALAKARELDAAIDWHLLGPLQSNKARRAAELFSTIHSLDRVAIVEAVDRAAVRLGVVRRGFLEVNLGAEDTKHGFSASGLLDALSRLPDLAGLELVGLMAIPPPTADPRAARPWFRMLRELRDQVSRLAPPRGWSGALSMGMSGDFEIAVEEGATHVRVGTSLFGPRPEPAAGDPA
ncbi:MAG: YggS family pyridoxal phosphate-dependent enzyme [Acidobacteriota bacterium]|nr:YggS family pyridoxal phosphate-dependent enzyme [Acidobacteriota bacterium]